MYYGVGRELADGNAWPNWAPTAEFRAIRDKDRAAGNRKKGRRATPNPSTKSWRGEPRRG